MNNDFDKLVLLLQYGKTAYDMAVSLEKRVCIVNIIKNCLEYIFKLSITLTCFMYCSNSILSPNNANYASVFNSKFLFLFVKLCKYKMYFLYSQCVYILQRILKTLTDHMEAKGIKTYWPLVTHRTCHIRQSSLTSYVLQLSIWAEKPVFKTAVYTKISPAFWCV